ncbi:MAG: hypothetical protein EZS28_018004 [Streblomastix strix]|uniref:Uncharacterized protein n=1 Tax=Streblomastix strix TaxID=222440 RepID=A0A5J4VUV3_9EUKA|nr:MAG: hypothetical protein EZS28_018004 [Streblomastix strix]
MKIPQCQLPLATDSNDDTPTELLVHLSDNVFVAITASSLAQIDVSYSFVLFLQIAIYQNGPQTVEQPIYSLICSSGLIGNQSSSAPTSIVRVQFAYGSSKTLKFILALAVVYVVTATAGNAAKLNYNAYLPGEIVIYQLTQHYYSIEQVALPFAPN